MKAFWQMTQFSLVEVQRRFRGASCLHQYRPDNGGSTHLWNVGVLRHYAVQYPRGLTPYTHCCENPKSRKNKCVSMQFTFVSACAKIDERHTYTKLSLGISERSWWQRNSRALLSGPCPPKSNPRSPRRGEGQRPRTANGPQVHISQGVRQRAEGCMALR
jgi:hypothetical protein